MANECLLSQLKREVNNSDLPFIFDFSYYGTDGLASMPLLNVDKTSPMPWAQTYGNVLGTTLYIATSEDSEFTIVQSNTRLVSDFIPVTPGMEISTTLSGSANVPIVICFDENKQPLGPSSTYCIWGDNSTTTVRTLTIPAGVAYIKVCMFDINVGYTNTYGIGGEHV